MAGRAVWAEVDLSAIAHNVAVLAARAAPARVCAVVKAGAYGHGAAEVSRAALEAGASQLAVAFVEEGAQLRQAGIDGPVLLLSEPPPEAMDDVVALRLTPTVYTEAGVETLAKAVAAAGGNALPVHLKVDTGMHRVGVSPAEAPQVAAAIMERSELRLEGVWTHFAVADDPDRAAVTNEQALRFRFVVDRLASAKVRPPVLHACNSAGTLAHPLCHHDMVRCGIGIYGVAPSPALEGVADLHPALSLRARVSHVTELEAGEAISYGLRYPLARRSSIATIPIGYADGVAWRLGVAEAEVLIGGRRRRVAGSVTMDQIMVDCGDGGVVAGDEVVLIGHQGQEHIGAWEWAERAGTIAYEILCGIGPRVPRVYL